MELADIIFSFEFPNWKSVRNLLAESSPPNWIAVIWDKQNVIEPALLRVPLVIFVFALLWALNIASLDRCKVPYCSVLSTKSINSTILLWISISCLTLYSGIITLANMSDFILEKSIIMFYVIFIICFTIPYTPAYEYRYHFFKLMKAVFIPMPNTNYLNFINNSNNNGLSVKESIANNNSPKSPSASSAASAASAHIDDSLSSTTTFTSSPSVMPFIEVLLADALTSLSKVFKDFGITIITLHAYFQDVSITTYHNQGMILLALLATVPFL